MIHEVRRIQTRPVQPLQTLANWIGRAQGVSFLCVVPAVDSGRRYEGFNGHTERYRYRLQRGNHHCGNSTLHSRRHMTNRFSRRTFLTRFLPALAPIALEQPYPPYSQPPAPDDDNPMDLTEEAWRNNVVAIFAVHWFIIQRHGLDIRRLKWLSPGPDLYQNKKGNV